MSPSRDRHRFRQRSVARPGGRAGDHRRAPPRVVRRRGVPGRGRPQRRGVLGADDRSRRAVPEDGRGQPGRLPGRLRGRVCRRAPSRSCASTSPPACPGTFKSARLGREMLPEREIHVVDSRHGGLRGRPCWRCSAATLRRPAGPRAEIAAEVDRAAPDVEAIVCLDTLEYLRRGGRISGAQAVIGTLLNVKPIIAIRERQGRQDRPGPDAGQGPRAGDRVHHVPPDRAPGDLPQHQPRPR